MSTDVGENSEQLDRGGQLFLVQLVFLLAAGICTLVRAYVKLFMVKHVTIDDYLIFSAMVSNYFHLQNNRWALILRTVFIGGVYRIWSNCLRWRRERGDR